MVTAEDAQEAQEAIQAEIEKRRAEWLICIDHACVEKTNDLVQWRVAYRCGHTFVRPALDIASDYLCPTCSNPQPDVVVHG